MIKRIVILCAVLAAANVVAEGTWWSAFNHPGLSSVIEQGLEANPDTAAAAAALEAARLETRSVRSGRTPQANIDAAYRWGREQSLETSGMEDDIDPFAVRGRIAWELDIFGRVGSAVDAAEARSGIRMADAAAVDLALSLEIAHTFIELAFQRERVIRLAQTVDDARAIHERAVRRVDAGLDTPTFKDTTRANLQQAEHQLMDAEILQEQLAARMRGLLGGEEPVASPGPLTSFALPAPPNLSSTNLHLGRPDVVRAHQVWVASQGEAGQASRARLPSLSLVVSAAGDGEDAADPEMWEAWAGPVLSIPLWDPKLGAQSRAAQARAREAQARFISVSQVAVQEIDQAWAERAQTEAMTWHMQERYDALNAVAASAERKRAAGLIQEPEYLEARIQMNDAAIRRARWTASGLQAHVSLIVRNRRVIQE